MDGRIVNENTWSPTGLLCIYVSDGQGDAGSKTAVNRFESSNFAKAVLWYRQFRKLARLPPRAPSPCGPRLV